MDLEPYLQQIEDGVPKFGIRQHLSIIPILDGWSSLVLEVDGETIFRFPRFQAVRAGLEKEAALLPELTKTLPVAVPRFEYVFLNDPHPTHGFVSYRKLPGVPLDRELIRQPLVIQDLAAFLSALHAFPAEQAFRLRVPRFSPQAWRQRYCNFYTWIQEHLFPLVSERPRTRVRNVWEPFLDDETNFLFQPVLIHSDLAAEHILCNLQSGRVTGVIDWEDAALGDPALDFAGLSYLGELDSLRAVIHAYQGAVAVDILEKRAAWYSSLAPYYQARYGLETGSLDHLHEGLNAL